MKKHGIMLLFSLLIGALLFPSPVLAQAIDPQYIFVRKSPMHCVPDCSYNWAFNAPSNINTTTAMDVINLVGTRGTDQRKLGIGVELNYNLVNFSDAKLSLQNLLNVSLTNNIPLFINLSGYQWWGFVSNPPNSTYDWQQGRPELWNWWDTTNPGYNVNNKDNVEWTCWDNSCATKKAWRDWGGGEFQVRPPPNLASRAFIDGSKARLAELVPMIVTWYNALSADKKWLLGGVSNGTEIDIGINYRVYQNNDTAQNDLAHSLPIGYAALKTAGIRNSGGPPTSVEINEVVRRYLNELDKYVYDQGIPRNKIFNHTAGVDLLPGMLPSTPNFPTNDSAFTAYGIPGWSFYGSVADNAQALGVLGTALNKIPNGQWASPEWLPTTLDYNNWVTALHGSLNFRNNRFINIANWENTQVRGNSEALRAIKTVLNETPSCWVGAPAIQSITNSGNTTTLIWQKGTNNDAVYLNISTVGDFNVSGTFNTVNVANMNVTAVTSWTSGALTSGKYYWELIADGCSGTQRKITDGSFVFTVSAPTSTPTPTLTPTPTPIPRPSLCSSSAISSSIISPFFPLTIIMTANKPLTTFALAFSNLNNLVSGIPQGIYFETGKQYVVSKNVATAVTSMSFPVAYADINKPDLNNTNQYPTNIQVNGYFIDPTTGATSLADSHCVVQFKTAIPGDVWGPASIPDGHVDSYDFTKIRADFGTVYSLYDYNDLVGNFGK